MPKPKLKRRRQRFYDSNVFFSHFIHLFRSHKSLSPSFVNESSLHPPFHPLSSLSVPTVFPYAIIQRRLSSSGSSMQISFGKWKFFRDIVKTSVRRTDRRRGSWPLALNGNKMHDWSDRQRERERESRIEFNDSKNSRPSPELSL